MMNDIQKAEKDLTLKSYKDYFSDESGREIEEIAEYNFQKEEFEKNYGVDFVDFAQRNIDEDYGGQTIRGMAKVKDVAYSAAAGLVDVTQELGEIGFDVAYGATNYAMTGEWGEASDEEKKDTWVNPEKAYESQTGTGEIAYGLSKLAGAGLPAKGVMTVAKSPKVVTDIIGKFSKTKVGADFIKGFTPILHGMIADGMAFYKDRENLSNFIKENSENEIVQKFADYLAVQEDDSDAEVALKQAAEGALTAGFVSPVVKVAKYIKLGSKSKKAVEEAITTLDDVVKETKNVKSVVDTDVVDDLADVVQSTEIPRDKIAISYEKKAEEIRSRLIDEGVDLDAINTDSVKALAETDGKIFENTIIALDNEKKVAQAAFDAIRGASDKLKLGEITKAERKEIMFKAIGELASSIGATKDVLNEAGTAMGVASKSDVHKYGRRMVEYLKENLDDVSMEKFAAAFDNAENIDDLAVKMDKMLSKKNLMKKPKDFLVSVIKNIQAIQQSMLLSNPGTLSKNISSEAVFGFVDSVEKIPQSLVSTTRNAFRNLMGLGSDTDIVRLREVSYNLSAMVDTTKQAFKDMLNFVSGNKSKAGIISKYREDIGNTSAFFGKQNEYDDKGFWRITRFLTKYSGRTVADTTDNLFGAGFAKADLMARADNATAKAIAERGLSEEQSKIFRTNFMKNATEYPVKSEIDLDDLKNLSAEAADVLSARKNYQSALDHAQEMTFRGGRGAITKYIVQAFETLPGLRLASPFISVASNIVVDRGLIDRTAIGLLSPRNWAKIAKGGREADKFWGRQILGNMTLLNIAFGEDDYITGNWSHDPKVRAVQQANGFQPYSIKINGTYYSYKDSPFGYVIAAGANIRDMINSRKIRTDDSDLVNYLIYAGQSAAQLVFDETSASVIKDVIDFSENKSPLIGERLISSLQNSALTVVPRWFSGFSGETEDGYKIRQVQDTFEQKLMARLGQETEPELDCLGDPMEASSNWLGLTKKEEPGGYLRDRLMEIGAGFDAPSRSERIDNNITLQLNKQDVRDVVVEMKNLGLQDELLSVLDGEEFTYIDMNDMLTDEGKKIKKRELLSNRYNEIKKQAIYNLIDNNERFSKLRSEGFDRMVKDKGLNPDYVSDPVSVLTLK